MCVSGIHIRSSTPNSLVTISKSEMSSAAWTIPSVKPSPTAKSSRSAGVAIMTACELPLYVNAIAVSSGMSRWPDTKWPACEAVRGRRAIEFGMGSAEFIAHLSLRSDQNRNRFGGRSFAFHIVVGQGEQWISLRVVRTNRTLRDAVGQHLEAAHHAPLTIVSERFDLDEGASGDSSLFHVELVHEDDHSASEHAAIPVVQSIDRGVVLVVASERRQPQYGCTIDTRILCNTFEDQKIGAACRGIPHQITWRRREMESARLTYPSIEVAEQCGENAFNLLADHIVVVFECRPLDYSIAQQRRPGHAADDRDLRFQLFARRMHETTRRMHHRHAVLHGDRLAPALLDVDVASGEAWKNQRLLAMDEVTAIELGGDRHGQAQSSHRRFGNRFVRHRGDKVSAEA